MDPIFTWSILTLVPLIVTVILFKLFENFAVFVHTSRGIKMGGAVAAYFILLGFSFSSWHFLIKDNTYDPLTATREELAGFWLCDGTYEKDGNVDEVESEMQIISNGHITIHGLTNTFRSWTADEILLKNNKMTFIYKLPLTNSLGLTSVSFIREENKITGFHGTWGAIGSSIKGSVFCEKQE